MSHGEAALILLSGGQDSTTCLYWARERFDRVEAIAYHYGQRHAIELKQAEKIARQAGVTLKVFDLSGQLSGSALLVGGADTRAPHPLDDQLPASFVPGRNALFLTHAASYGYTRGIFDVVGGMCQTDYSGYPDCRQVFIDAIASAMSLALDRAVRIHTPLMYLTKAETWKLAADLGVLDIVRAMSHTDYHGDRSTWNDWGYGRLDNPASELRAQGYAEARAKGWVPEGPISEPKEL